jgi:hypothetical protein
MHPVARISCRDAKIKFVATKLATNKSMQRWEVRSSLGENEDDV